MESGVRPGLNAQRYAERWLSLSKSPYGIVTTTGGNSGKVNSECCEPGNFGTRPSYEGTS